MISTKWGTTKHKLESKPLIDTSKNKQRNKETDWETVLFLHKMHHIIKHPVGGVVIQLHFYQHIGLEQELL